MKKLFLLFILCSIGITSFNQNQTYQQKLYYTCKVWGFVKYFHSRVSLLEVNWDSVLIATLPLIKNASSNNDFNDALVSMLNAAGPMYIATSPSPDTLPPELKRNLNFGWIDDPVFRTDVKILLDTIKNNFRPHTNGWYTYGGYQGGGYTGFIWFPYDDPMIDTSAYICYPPEFTRLMILFKYWNIMNYFNPYNYVLDTPWDSTLYHFVIPLATAADYVTFYKTIERMTTFAQDAHVDGLTWNSNYSLYGYYSPKIILKHSRGNYIVVKSGYSTISRGDIIESVDNKTVIQWEDSLCQYISAGNSSVFRRLMCNNMLGGVQGSQIQIIYRDSIGDIQSGSFMRNDSIGIDWFTSYYINDTLGTIKWRKWDCNVGYINMGLLLISDIDTMYSILKNTNAIIFDIRNYPNGTAWNIANLIYPDKICFSIFSLPDFNYPGTYSWFGDYLGVNGNINSYKGKVIILCNERTISQAEFSCMILKAMPNSVIIGSQTSGTDGNISYFHLSNDIQTGLTSLGVYYPNGDSTERIGIVPDSIVYITPAGIRQGRDEVLEKALQVANCLVPMLSVTPQNQNVADSEGATSFSITCNTNWSVVSDSSWCTVTSSGSGNGTITASYTKNPYHQTRIANIRVSVAGLPVQTVTVTQAKSTIGVEEYQKNICQIYPNPTKGTFYIVNVPGNEIIQDISIQDVNGKVIYSKIFNEGKEYQIDLSSAPQGLYQVIIKTANIQVVRKLVIIK